MTKREKLIVYCQMKSNASQIYPPHYYHYKVQEGERSEAKKILSILQNQAIPDSGLTTVIGEEEEECNVSANNCYQKGCQNVVRSCLSYLRS